MVDSAVACTQIAVSGMVTTCNGLTDMNTFEQMLEATDGVHSLPPLAVGEQIIDNFIACRAFSPQAVTSHTRACGIS